MIVHNIWALDLHPETAARYHSDSHLKASLYMYAQMLAYAWHDRHNAVYMALPDNPADDPVTPWLRIVHVERVALRRAAFPGEQPFSWWTLLGQRIPSRANSPWGEWVSAKGGNYRWLWRLAMELTVECFLRFGRLHPASAAVWTLELVPFSLEDDPADDWSEPPLGIPYHLRVTADGYYDGVASNRRFYGVHHDTLTWTGREPPPWLQEEHRLSHDSQPI